MRISLSFRKGCLIGAVALAPFPAFAQSAEAEHSHMQISIAGVHARVTMPCAEPRPAPAEPADIGGFMGEMGGQLLVFVTAEGFVRSEGEALSEEEPFSSDFDFSRTFMKGSDGTQATGVTQVDRRRSVIAAMNPARGPDPEFGLLNAIEIAPGAVVYAVALSRPGPAGPMPDQVKDTMRAFAELLEVSA
jgi:hypothetical protein